MSSDLAAREQESNPSDLPTPAQQLDALLAEVSALSKLALDIVQCSIDLDGQFTALLCFQRSPPISDKVVSKLAVDLTRHSVAINNQIPQVVCSHVDAAIAEIRRTSSFTILFPISVDILQATRVFYQGTAPTPTELDALFPPGQGDNKAYHVVCVGRAPGLYDTA